MNELHGSVGQAVQASHIDTLNVAPNTAAMPMTALDGLAPSSPLFVGRADELQVLAAERFVVVSGLAGVGKTELVLHHAQSRDFPGGRLFWNFHGYDRARRTTASDALDSFLRALGVVEIPSAEADKAALYRSLVATREPMLIVLDNACTAAQVRPLVVACHQIVVTSRHRLTSLDGATSLDLGVLTDEDATSLVGDAEVATLCGRLPLALAIMRALRTSDPGNDWASDFRGARLSLLVNDDRDVRAAFDLSHQELSAEQQRFFRLLALHPGDVITLDGAAALAKVDQMTAKRLLRDLRTASLLDQQNRFHDLIRAYATERVEAEPADIRTDAEDRLVRHFGERALAALADADPDSLEWLAAHVQALAATAAMARQSGREAESVVLAWALAVFMSVIHVGPTSPLDHVALRAWNEAVTQAQRAIDLRRADGYAEEFLDSVHNKSEFLIAFGNSVFIERMQAALDLVIQRGDKMVIGVLSSVLGSIHLSFGDHKKALDYCTTALDTQVVTELDKDLITNVHRIVARALRGLDRHVEAVTHLEIALKDRGDTNRRGADLIELGEIHHGLGDIETARRCWEEAVQLLDGTTSKVQLGKAKRWLLHTS